MFKKRRAAIVQACEHLKAFVSTTVDRYHEQAVDPATVKLALWNEVQRTVQQLQPVAFQDVAWFRVSTPIPGAFQTRHVLDILDSFGTVLSVFRLGARQASVAPGGLSQTDDAPLPTTPTVVYVTARMRTAVEAAAAVLALETKGFEVRDWWYGGAY